MILTLTSEVVESYEKLLTNPAGFGLEFPAMNDCFEYSNEITAKHELAQAYIDHIEKDVPKLIIYIIMTDWYGECKYRDSSGLLGYPLKFNPPNAQK